METTAAMDVAIKILWFFVYLNSGLTRCQALTVFPSGLYHILFSDYTDLEFTFIKNATNTSAMDQKTIDTNETLSELLDDVYIVNPNRIMSYFNTFQNVRGQQDDSRYTELNSQIYKELSNTRRQRYEPNFGYFDPYDTPWWNRNWNNEYRKMNVVKMLGLQFLIISRYQIGKAFRYVAKSRRDKRYKIGYLFCRCRNINVEMTKLLSASHQLTFHSNTKHYTYRRDTEALFRFYQQITRMDVDMKDTIELIRDLYEKNEDFDYEIIDLGGKNKTEGSTPKPK